MSLPRDQFIPRLALRQVGTPTDVIFWLRPADIARVLELPISVSPRAETTTPRALPTRHGLLVHTVLAHRTLVRGPSSRGARCFLRADGVKDCWIEWRRRTSCQSPPRSEATRAERDSRITLLAADASHSWSAPPPSTWSPLCDVLRWDFSSQVDVEPTLDAGPEKPLLVRLVPATPIEHVAGCLARIDHHPDFGRRLSALEPRERRDLRLFATSSHWCLFSARGLDERCPRVGRLLRDLGTPIEPVLVPVDRTPAPGFHGAELLRCHGVDAGEGLLWWDDDGEERSVRIRRGELLTPTDDVLRDWRW
jgi:hypothetical protein